LVEGVQMSQSQQKRARRALLGDRTIRATVERLMGYEGLISEAMPEWWKFMEILRVRRSSMASELPGGWPEWCLMPIPALHSTLPSNGEPGGPMSEARNELIARMLGFYAWRQGRTVWRFDPDVAAALLETEDMGRVPAEVLRRLPLWGVYIQRPDGDWPGVDADGPCAGILARLTTQAIFDFDPTGAPVLEIQYDLPGNGGIGIPLSMVPLIEDISLNDALALVRRRVTEREAQLLHLGDPNSAADDIEAERVRPWLALLMYLCSKGADTERRDPPPSGRHRGPRREPGGTVTRVDVGFRIGAAIRKYRSTSSTEASTGKSVAPHLRRAHFHTYYSGAGSKSDPSKRCVEVKWLPPIAVGVGEVAPVVRPVDA